MPRIVVPDAPRLEHASAPLARAFARLLRKQGTVDAMRRNTAEVGKLLARARPALVALHARVADLAHALARLGQLHAIKNKATRQAVYERKGQLEVIAMALRFAGRSSDASLAALAAAVDDGEIRGVLAEVLRGGQINMRAGAAAEVAALLDDTRDPVTIRCALEALYAASPKRARARWKAALAAANQPELVNRVLDQLEAHEAYDAVWAKLVYPLTLHRDRAIAGAAGSWITRDAAVFEGYVAWAASHRDLAAAIGVISHNLYWAWLRDRELATTLREPLQALRTRAAARKQRASVAALDRALTKIGVGEPAPRRPLGARLARVGTDGGPPLAVPAEHLAAWLGTEGPRPFDSGKSDYERACDRRRPSLLRIGKGHGIVLDAQSCTVHAEPSGILLIADGDPGEEVVAAWKRIGTLTLAKRGLVVLDAAEAGAGKGRNRATVPLTPGTYNVYAHSPAGFGGDFSAARLVRVAPGREARAGGSRREADGYTRMSRRA